MKSAMERLALAGIRGDHLQWRAGIAALGLLLIIYMGSGATAWALQILEASDHAELTAEISDSDVNRIALDGDRVSRVIQSPGGFTVEHDAVRGDLYLYPDAAAVFAPGPENWSASDNRSAPAGVAAPVTLYLGTEQGFTYRLSLTVVSRDSAQILIRNAAVAAKPVDRVRTVGGGPSRRARVIDSRRGAPGAGCGVRHRPGGGARHEHRTGFAPGALEGSAVHRAGVEHVRRERG